MTRPVVARPRRASPILICKKCLKRSCEGGEIKRELKHALKSRHSEKLKPPRLVSTSCLGICPKRSVVLASGQSLRGGEYILVSDRREIEGALKSLLPSDEQVRSNGAQD